MCGTPWSRIAIDITGKHPKSRNVNEFILTVMDFFTKCTEAFQIRDHKAQTVARILLNQVFSRLGMPEELLTDQGPEFKSQLVTELCKSFGIAKIRTSPYRP